ncbi:MAG: cell wall-binding repeat-containing protein [Clostridiales bacterium]|nr:cell wall-binding repeat-containing protein [Candidatus Crickella merdequi]
MQKKIKSCLLVLTLCFSIIASPIAAEHVEATSVTDASVYWITGYGSGGYCTLSANIYMIRRAMIARGSTKWSSVTYSSAGPALCTSVPTMKWNYTYSCDGVTVKGTHVTMTGSASQKAAQLRKLLDSHPEGVVVRGNRLAGYSHGALLTGYYGTGNNQFYVADSTHNASKFVSSPKGIETWASSTLNDMSNVQDAWYLTSISGVATSARNTYVLVSGKLYYVDANGKFVTGWYTVSGNKCYFDPADGHKLFGWQTIDGQKYYLDPKTGAAVSDCKKTIDGKTYIFDKTGVVANGWCTLGEEEYYATEEGLLYGYCIVDEQPECFDPVTGVHCVSSNAINTINYVFGADRFATSIKIADALKYQLGKDKFDAVIVASGMDYPDALSGGFLAEQKEAPMLLVGPNSETCIKKYIENNLSSDGTIYILGGYAAVSKSFEQSVTKDGITVKRLEGANRFGTNMAVLNEVGVTTDAVIICSSFGYADSISASAAKKPILLVGGSLTEEQSEYIGKYSKAYIIGGSASISPAIEAKIRSIIDKPVENETLAANDGVMQSNVKRLWGATRFDTSIAVANEFISNNADCMILAYGLNFPDGLSAGPFAAAMNAPIVLATPSAASGATSFAREHGINSTFAIGGPTFLTPATTAGIISQ